MIPNSFQQQPRHYGKHLLLERLKLDLHPKRTFSSSNGLLHKGGLHEGSSALSVARSSNLKQKQLFRKNNSSSPSLNRLETPSSSVSTMSAFYESERIMLSSTAYNFTHLDSERKIVIDASGAEGQNDWYVF